jgi:two-component system, cell cycle sensor histidine kinase and response regulator CckA
MTILDQLLLNDESAVLEARSKVFELSLYCDYNETRASHAATFSSELARLLVSADGSAQFLIEAEVQGTQLSLRVSFSGNRIEKLAAPLRKFFTDRVARSAKYQHEYQIFFERSYSGAAKDAGLREIKKILQENSEPIKLARLADALSAEKERLSVTLQSIHEGVITTDAMGRIVQINRAAQELTGFTLSEATEMYADDVLHVIDERENVRYENLVSRAISEKLFTDFGRFTVIHSKDGERLPVELTASPILNDAKGFQGVVLVLRDVNEERSAALERERAGKLESVGLLAGGIAHDFNNYLGIMLGNLELASSKAQSESDIHSHLSQAENAIQKASKLTQQLLTFSKGGDPILETASLADLIIESVEFVLRGSNSSWTHSIPDDLWMADIDIGQIDQVIQNIVLNASQAMSKGGTVSVVCENVNPSDVQEELPLSQGSFIKMTISDEGPGMSNALIEKVFDPYFTTKKEGNGLGLAICHSIIQKHGGYINVQSDIGQGTCFTIYLPADKTGGIKNSPEIESVLFKHHLTVLVMDDDVTVRQLLEQQLVFLGHRVWLTADGEAAIEQYEQLKKLGTRVDLVILDLTVPGGMGGQETATKLLHIDPDIKVVVSSGYSNDPVMSDFRAHGFAGVIAKPFRMAELSEVLDAVANS